jgi:hypothetical protein
MPLFVQNCSKSRNPNKLDSLISIVMALVVFVWRICVKSCLSIVIFIGIIILVMLFTK